MPQFKLAWDAFPMKKNCAPLSLISIMLQCLETQGWKLQTDSNSLASRLFKSKYYSNSSYLDSKLGHNPSFVWHSIHSVKVVFRQGACWKIGSGFNIPIIGEPWVGTGSSIPLVGPGAIAIQSYFVGHLIDQSNKVWNEQLIRQVFLPETAQSILNTPLYPQLRTDSLLWKAEKNGFYSVKSAYHICIEDIANNAHLRKPGY